MGMCQNKMTYPTVSCRGRGCPKTQNKLFSGERTSSLRAKRQHYPRFDPKLTIITNIIVCTMS